jgi:hypothetical protein
MPYEDFILRQKIERRAQREAERLQGERPETAAEQRQRRNPNVLDISGATILGLAYLEGMTT